MLQYVREHQKVLPQSHLRVKVMAGRFTLLYNFIIIKNQFDLISSVERYHFKE